MFLLSEVRKKLLLIWLSFSALLLIFFLLQILNGKYAGMENIAWGLDICPIAPRTGVAAGCHLAPSEPGEMLVVLGVLGDSGAVGFLFVFCVGFAGGYLGWVGRTEFGGGLCWVVPIPAAFAGLGVGSFQRAVFQKRKPFSTQ